MKRRDDDSDYRYEKDDNSDDDQFENLPPQKKCKKKRVDERKKAKKKLPELFTFEGFVFFGKCIHVHDGDSVHITVKMATLCKKLLGDETSVQVAEGAETDETLLKCRLEGIDAPELYGKNGKVVSDLEKEVAKKARDRLSDLVLNQPVVVQCGKFDMYGRVLITIWPLCRDCAMVAAEKDKVPNEFSAEYRHSINQKLIDEGLAYEYYGKTKRPFTEWYAENRA